MPLPHPQDLVEAIKPFVLLVVKMTVRFPISMGIVLISLFIYTLSRAGVPVSALIYGFGGLFPLVGGHMLYALLHSRHGLLDPRNKVRTDVLGDVATPVQEPTVMECVASFLSFQRVGSYFHAYVLSQLDVESDKEFGETMFSRFSDAFKNHQSPLLRGDLKAEAERRWPYRKDEHGDWQGQFELHLNLPDDMEPCIFNHDKLISGDDVSLLCYRLFNREDLQRAYVASLQRLQETVSYVPGATAMFGVGAVMLAFQSLSNYTESPFIGGFLALIFGISLACGVGVLVLTTFVKFALHVRSVAAFANHKVNSDVSLRTVTLAQMRNKEEVKSPAGGVVALRGTLRMAMRDKTPRFQLGIAFGEALLHGVSPAYAYSEGQPVCVTNEDISRGGVLILGGTGSGKSYGVIVPLAAQIMQYPFDSDEIAKAEAGGYQMTASIVTYDPKAQLHVDFTSLARAYGWLSRNVGTKEGEFGIDLFDGISAVIVSSILSEAVSQKSNGSGSADPFWGSMASKIRYASAVIARVYEVTDKGLEEVEKTGERIYSPAGVYKLAMACRSNDGYLFKVIEDIIRNVRDPQLRRYIAPLCGPELIAAIDFLRRDVLTLFSETTVGGFLANVSDSLADFVSENDIRERFGAARGNILDLDRLWDHKTVTNFCLSKTKYGDISKVIVIMAKIRQYHWGAVRLERNATLAKLTKQNIFIDECQEFATKGGTYSEAQFINMSRAMGMSFIMATQTKSAVVEALGSERSVDNMFAQLRSKVFLGTEDEATVRYMQSTIGTTLQTHIRTDKGFESRLTLRKEHMGSIKDHVVPEPTTDEDILLMSHPLVHGRVEPLIRGANDTLGKAYADQGLEAYEVMYVQGEEWIEQYSSQGRVTSFVSNKLKSVIPTHAAVDVPTNTFTPTHVFHDLTIPAGEAVVVTNRGTMKRFDKVLLSHYLGFIPPTGDKDAILDVTAKEVTSSPEQLSTAAGKVHGLRDANASITPAPQAVHA